MSLRGRQVDVDIDALDDRARGVGTVDDVGRSIRVTVAGLVPGERAQVEVSWQHRRHALAHARVVALERTSSARRAAPCAQHDDPAAPGPGACAGCPLQSITVQAQRELKLSRIRETLGLHVDRIVGGEPWGYRWSAKRVAAGRPGALVLGSRRPRDEAVADMAGCLVDHPRIVAAVDALVRVADEMTIAPYDAVARTGELRYVWLKTDGARVSMTLVAGRADAEARISALGEAIGARFDEALGVSASLQDDPGNAIRGGPARSVVGEPSLDVPFGTLGRVRVGPLGFLQPNPEVAALAYADLLDGLPDDEGSEVFDLYAGAGLTTRRLRERFARVVPCESFPESARDLGVEPVDVEAFTAAALAAGRRPAVVIANPPRGGMGHSVSAALRELGPAHLRIMSCRPETLVRDLAVLGAMDGPGASYEVTRATAYDTLPHTAHVEVVVWLRRRP